VKQPASPESISLSVAADSRRVLVRSIGVTLPEQIRTYAAEKMDRLLRHHGRIIRIRLDLQRDHANDPVRAAVAGGRIEIPGPDLVARVSSSTFFESIDLLVDKLDRMLRERTKHRVNGRNDRHPGTEFRDLLAPASLSST
jgi:putative sigma-54 modulation protein